MLVTSSRRPGHRTRLLCRELARVLPGWKYVPRGAKTVRKLASLAASLGHARVVLVNSLGGQPHELRFLDVTAGWRWLDARVELGEVKLQRELGQNIGLEGTTVYAEGERAKEFANFLEELVGLPIGGGPPKAGGVALITSDDGLKLHFRAGPNPEPVGPVLQIASFGRLGVPRRA